MKFVSQMPDALGVCGTMCKIKKEENLFWGESQLPLQIARTRVRLLYIQLLVMNPVCKGEGVTIFEVF